MSERRPGPLPLDPTVLGRPSPASYGCGSGPARPGGVQGQSPWPSPLCLPSPNCDDRPAGTAIDTIVLHYTGMQDAASAIARLRDPIAAVSAHYVVEEDGTLWQLVAEHQRAYHAGISYWRGHTALNVRSIGIEIVNPGHEWGYRPFPAVQMAAVRDLCLALQSRHPIDPRNIVAHSDIAPNRKQDPGELFDWPALAAAGIGLWPTGTATPRAPLQDLLAQIGYDITLPEATAAFQRRYRPRLVNGIADPETTARAQALVDLIG